MTAHAKRVHEIARAAVADHTRKALASSPLYGKESALTFALGYIEPGTGPSDAEHLARIRGVFAGLRDAGLFT